MENTAIGFPSTYESYGCRVNDLDPAELFRRYELAGFLYEQKRRLLAPFLDLIVDNWRKGLLAGEELIWVATFQDEEHWSSVGSWLHTHVAWNSQHLVATGSTLASAAALKSAGAVRCRKAAEGVDLSQQNWFRPTNRFAARVFGSLVDTIGSENAAVRTFDYLAWPRGKQDASPWPGCRIGEWDGRGAEVSAGLVALAGRARGRVYAVAEELGHADPLLAGVDARYRRVGLRRYRRIWLARREADGAVVGAALACRGPLGFNFSFLENRCDLLLDPDLSRESSFALAAGLAASAALAYEEDYPPPAFPVIAEPACSAALEAAGARKLRQYAQSIWLRDGYAGWYRHVEKFYARIEKAGHRRGLGAKSVDWNDQS